MEIYIIVIIIVAAVFALGLLVRFIYKKLANNKPRIKVKKVKEKKKKQQKEEKFDNSLNVKLIDKYMYRRELLFWKFLNSILPKQFVVCPKVAINSIIMPDGDKKTYNNMLDKYLDYIVFDEQNMHPVLAIDFYDSSYSDMKLEEKEPDVYNLLNYLKIKQISLNIQANFDKEDIRHKLYKALNIAESE